VWEDRGGEIAIIACGSVGLGVQIGARCDFVVQYLEGYGDIQPLPPLTSFSGKIIKEFLPQNRLAQPIKFRCPMLPKNQLNINQRKELAKIKAAKQEVQRK
jgi:hypothetical protein